MNNAILPSFRNTQKHLPNLEKGQAHVSAKKVSCGCFLAAGTAGTAGLSIKEAWVEVELHGAVGEEALGAQRGRGVGDPRGDEALRALVSVALRVVGAIAMMDSW